MLIDQIKADATPVAGPSPHYRGRVMALWSVALVGSTPIGAPLIGAVSQAVDPRAAIGLGALACVGAAALSPIGRRRPMDRPVTGLPSSHARPSPRPSAGDRSDVAQGNPTVAAHPPFAAIIHRKR